MRVTRAGVRRWWVIGNAIACTLIVEASASPARAGLRAQLPNQIALEVGGRMPFLGIEYERWLGDHVGFGVGLGGVPCVECETPQGGKDGYLVLTIPLYAVVNVPLGEHHGLGLSAGATLAPPGPGEATTVLPSLGIGYQLLLEAGFTLRASYLLLFNASSTTDGKRPIPWAGVQLGWAF